MKKDNSQRLDVINEPVNVPGIAMLKAVCAVFVTPVWGEYGGTDTTAVTMLIASCGADAWATGEQRQPDAASTR